MTRRIHECDCRKNRFTGCLVSTLHVISLGMRPIEATLFMWFVGIPTQKGELQPIHYAAQQGHESAVMMLIKDFHVKPDAKTAVG